MAIDKRGPFGFLDYVDAAFVVFPVALAAVAIGYFLFVTPLPF